MTVTHAYDWLERRRGLSPASAACAGGGRR
jgi:hypothetical protein